MAAEGEAAKGASSRRLESAGAAYEELKSGFDSWSGSLSTYGNYTAYAAIAANWAVHSSRDALLSNNWSKWSMIVAVAYLGVHLTCVGVMTLMYRRRCEYANADDVRWNREFKNVPQGSAWPYSDAIQNLGEGMRFLHVLGPLASGVFLLVSMFRG